MGEGTDVYALGVSIYWCIFGSHLWNIGNKADFRMRLRKRDVTPTLTPEQCWTVACPRVAAVLNFLCLRCVNADPRLRPPLPWVITILE